MDAISLTDPSFLGVGWSFPMMKIGAQFSKWWESPSKVYFFFDATFLILKLKGEETFPDSEKLLERIMLSRDIRIENGEELYHALTVLEDLTRLLKASYFWTGRKYVFCMPLIL